MVSAIENGGEYTSKMLTYEESYLFFKEQNCPVLDPNCTSFGFGSDCFGPVGSICEPDG